MKRLAVSIVILVLLLVSGCSAEANHDLNVRLNPNSYIDVSGYKIQLPAFEGREAIYVLRYGYIDLGKTIVLNEWWYDNGAPAWNPVYHNGQYIIPPPYSIESVTISTLPKEVK